MVFRVSPSAFGGLAAAVGAVGDDVLQPTMWMGRLCRLSSVAFGPLLVPPVGVLTCQS